MNKKSIVLIGGGGHCKSCIDIIESLDNFKIEGILDVATKVGEKILGYPIIGTDFDIPKLIKEKVSFLITTGDVGNPEKRVELFFKVVHLGGKLPVIVSSYAYVSKYAKIYEGTIIMHHAMVNASAEIGKNCIINTKALIEHDAVIGDHCHISTGAIVNGGTTIGSCTFFGSNAVSKQYITVQEHSFVKANTIIK